MNDKQEMVVNTLIGIFAGTVLWLAFFFLLSGCNVQPMDSMAGGFVQGYSVGQGGVYIPPAQPRATTCLPWLNGIRCTTN